jgi:hypothetical protein
MNDDELMMLVREQRAAVPMTTPVDEILARGDMLRARNRIPRLLGALAGAAGAAGAAVAAIAAPAAPGRRAAPRARRARRLLTWHGPATAVAVVLLVAATLVTLKSLRNEHAAPVASPNSVAAPALAAGSTPRYFVAEQGVKDGLGKDGMGLAWAVTDAQTGKQVGSVSLPGQPTLGEPIAAAADDRTFVAPDAVTRQTTVQVHGRTVQGPPTLESLTWYLLRIFPGSADPVRITRLPIAFTAGDGEISAVALSGDGTQLAVAYRTGDSVTLRIYSVATGQQQHSWSATFAVPAGGPRPVTDLSWVGDDKVGFAVTYNPKVREEVRTLNTGAAGTGLLADSRVVWSQYVPEPPHDVYSEGTPQACVTPFLSGNGQAVVCATSTYSASEKRLSAVWLAYPVATPTRPRVLASIQQPKDVSSLSDPPGPLDWVNASGTEVIGEVNDLVITFPGGRELWSNTGYTAVVAGGTVRPFPPLTNSTEGVAW